ncbi:MAG: hypothetical protein LBG87_02560 [Spirochaetaceae bacterium]|jgi:hypothetical protein|nr:hypothetical protein [Spirochaetaceae bacterium]
MKISKDTFLSPEGVFVLYILLSCIAIMGFKFLAPPEPSPLAIYAKTWRFLQGVLAYIGIFPALVMSALVIPFGFWKSSQKEFGSFSPDFLDRVRTPIILAIIGVALYGALFFLAFPLAQDYETHLRSQGSLFASSKEKAELSAEKGNWPDAAQFISICEQIWPDSPEIETLRSNTIMGMEEWRIAQANSQMEAWVEEDPYQDIAAAYSGITGQQNPVNAAEALALADKALQSERYYDAHWLANLGVRLAKPGSLERVQGTRLASQAWNRVGSLEPTARETETYALYRKKREGYEALVSEDWIHAYYIFKKLSIDAPGDPDVDRFLRISENGINAVAFFTDEMELALGEIHAEALFSFPLRASAGKKNGRTVLRIGSLFATEDFSYGLGIDLMAFDGDGKLLYQVEAPYAKILPIMLDSGSHVVLMMRALDRIDRQKTYEPIWSGPDQTIAQDARLMLDITYEDFLLLSRLRRGLNPLLIGELLAIAKRIGSYGYIPQLFQSEILYRFSEAAIFLPLTILIIVVGWRFRAVKRSRVWIPMLIVLPLVFNGVAFFCRSMINTFSQWSVIAFGFSTAIIFFSAGMVILFIFALIVLVAQHG